MHKPQHIKKNTYNMKIITCTNLKAEFYIFSDKTMINFWQFIKIMQLQTTNTYCAKAAVGGEGGRRRRRRTETNWRKY